MHAWAVVENNAPLRYIEIADPKPVGSEVLVEVTHCGVCHTDLHFWTGSYNLGGGKLLKLADRGITLPRAIGHEVVGRVTALGAEATGVAIGDLRIVFPWIGCGFCERCVTGNDNLCDTPQALGVWRNGGFASHVLLPHPRFLVDPGAIDPALAATFACCGVSVYSAIKKIMPVAPHEPIVLIGAGGLGLTAISMLKAFGHETIISVDLNAEKRAAALAAGVTAVVDGGVANLAEAIVIAAHRPVKAVIDFVNTGTTAQAALDALDKGGKLVLVGVAGGEIALSLAGLVFKPRAIEGSMTGTLQDLRDVVALAQSGKLKPIPITRIAKDKANEAMEMLHHGQITGRIVLTTEMTA